ncbi:MAG: hypothetical protein ABH950_06435 [Candidatus Altiarchaeota archaeon]
MASATKTAVRRRGPNLEIDALLKEIFDPKAPRTPKDPDDAKAEEARKAAEKFISTLGEQGKSPREVRRRLNRQFCIYGMTLDVQDRWRLGKRLRGTGIGEDLKALATEFGLSKTSLTKYAHIDPATVFDPRKFHEEKVFDPENADEKALAYVLGVFFAARAGGPHSQTFNQTCHNREGAFKLQECLEEITGAEIEEPKKFSAGFTEDDTVHDAYRIGYDSRKLMRWLKEKTDSKTRIPMEYLLSFKERREFIRGLLDFKVPHTLHLAKEKFPQLQLGFKGDESFRRDLQILFLSAGVVTTIPSWPRSSKFRIDVNHQKDLETIVREGLISSPHVNSQISSTQAKYDKKGIFDMEEWEWVQDFIEEREIKEPHRENVLITAELNRYVLRQEILREDQMLTSTQVEEKLESRVGENRRILSRGKETVRHWLRLENPVKPNRIKLKEKIESQGTLRDLEERLGAAELLSMSSDLDRKGAWDYVSSKKEISAEDYTEQLSFDEERRNVLDWGLGQRASPLLAAKIAWAHPTVEDLEASRSLVSIIGFFKGETPASQGDSRAIEWLSSPKNELEVVSQSWDELGLTEAEAGFIWKKNRSPTEVFQKLTLLDPYTIPRKKMVELLTKPLSTLEAEAPSLRVKPKSQVNEETWSEKVAEKRREHKGILELLNSEEIPTGPIAKVLTAIGRKIPGRIDQAHKLIWDLAVLRSGDDDVAEKLKQHLKARISELSKNTNITLQTTYEWARISTLATIVGDYSSSQSIEKLVEKHFPPRSEKLNNYRILEDSYAEIAKYMSVPTENR